MALLRGSISDQGPLIDVAVGVSKARAKVLQANGMAVPALQYLRVLIDTGSHLTGFMPSVFRALQIQPFAIIPVRTTSTKPNEPCDCEQFDVSVTLGVGKRGHKRLSGIYAIACHDFLHTDESHGILGRDVLQQCNFFYYGQEGYFELGF